MTGEDVMSRFQALGSGAIQTQNVALAFDDGSWIFRDHEDSDCFGAAAHEERTAIERVRFESICRGLLVSQRTSFGPIRESNGRKAVCCGNDVPGCWNCRERQVFGCAARAGTDNLLSGFNRTVR
jgi:hypothetical protein